jgi:type IV fimbrial biogenesis protein FimT
METVRPSLPISGLPVPPRIPAGGFTVVELMVTVTVISIMLSVAGPMMSGFVADQRSRNAAGDLFMSLNKARSEALKRGASVTLKPTGSNWQDGWTIPNPSDASLNIEEHGALKGLTITGPSDVTYRSSGRVSGTSEPTPFKVSASGTQTIWCVTIDLSGRPYQKKSESTSC